MVCPKEGLDKELFPEIADVLPEYDAFKKKLAEYIVEYRKGGLGYKVLLECWEREAAKRNKKP